MSTRRCRCCFSLLALWVMLWTLAGCAAARNPNEGIPTPAGPLPTVPAATPRAPSPELKEKRLVSLEWPSTIREGDGDVMRLTIEMDESGRITPTAEVAGHEVQGKAVEIPNLYDTHNVMVSTRLDLAGIEVKPGDVQLSPLRPGAPVTFYWSLKAQEAGTYRGIVWLSFQATPQQGGQTVEIPLMAQQVNIQVISFLGLPAPVARWWGIVGSLISTLLSIPFLENILSLVFRRKKKLTA